MRHWILDDDVFLDSWNETLVGAGFQVYASKQFKFVRCNERHIVLFKYKAARYPTATDGAQITTKM